MSNWDIAELNNFIEQEIALGHLPGAVLVVTHRGNELGVELFTQKLLQ